MILTLTTDFGDSGGFVAQLKAQILNLFKNNINIVDITHNISPFNTVEGAYIIRTTIPEFEKGSIHIVVIDPGVGSKRNIVALKFRSSYIISPDNEALSMIEPDLVIKIDKDKVNPNSPKTFEAYGIMVPAAYLLYKNGIESLGKQCKLSAPKLFPIKRKQLIKGKIVYIDRFGNCITNIEGYLFEKQFRLIKIKNLEFKHLSSTYSENEPYGMALINSSGFLEFSLYKNSFASKFKISYLDDVEVFL
jgi:hypothetical protein